nr:hypothetical protein [Nonomuraea sp. SYSU D8015]
MAFPATHPAVTSVIIGPRTMEQVDATLKGASVTLDDATLDRIDEIVPPGTNLYQPDGAWRPPALADVDGPPPPPRRPLRRVTDRAPTSRAGGRSRADLSGGRPISRRPLGRPADPAPPALPVNRSRGGVR